jgi:hypothetical protein
MVEFDPEILAEILAEEERLITRMENETGATQATHMQVDEEKLRQTSIQAWGDPSLATTESIKYRIEKWVAYGPRDDMEKMRVRMLKEVLLRRSLIDFGGEDG